MQNIYYGDMKEAVYNTSAYFKYDYEDRWIVDPFVKEMIQDVDKSTVLDSGVIDSPVLGKIPPTELSGGVKTLILFKFNKDKIFNASTCGDNCAKWLLPSHRTTPPLDKFSRNRYQFFHRVNNFVGIQNTDCKRILTKIHQMPQIYCPVFRFCNFKQPFRTVISTS